MIMMVGTNNMFNLKEHLATTFHQAPEGYHYEVVDFNTKFKAILICFDRQFLHNDGEPVKCIWGFVRTKDGEYFAPINRKKVGKAVRIEDTRPHTAMKLNLNPLELAMM